MRLLDLSINAPARMGVSPNAIAPLDPSRLREWRKQIAAEQAARRTEDAVARANVAIDFVEEAERHQSFLQHAEGDEPRRITDGGRAGQVRGVGERAGRA